jgi:hypothetical protein
VVRKRKEAKPLPPPPAEKRRTKPRPTRLLVTPTDETTTYEECLRKMRKSLDPEKIGERVRTIRRVGENGVALIMQGRQNGTKLSAALTEVFGKEAVKVTEPVARVKVLDLDAATTREELEASITSLLPAALLKNISVVDDGRDGKLAFVTMDAVSGGMLAKAGKIVVGWTRCRVRTAANTRRCYRCHEYGHLAVNCSSEDRSENCLNCDGKGHTMATCKKPPHCPLCNAAHRMGSTNRCKAHKPRHSDNDK